MDGGTILLLLALLIVCSVVALLAYAAYANLPKVYVLKIRPNEHSTRSLTSHESTELARAVGFTEITEGCFQGMRAVARRDLNKVCDVLDLEIDERVQTQCDGIHLAVLRYRLPGGQQVPSSATGNTGSGAAITRGARAESSQSWIHTYALKIAADDSEPLRTLTRDERDLLAKSVQIVDISHSPLQGLTAVKSADLGKACAALGAKVHYRRPYHNGGIMIVELRYLTSASGQPASSTSDTKPSTSITSTPEKKAPWYASRSDDSKDSGSFGGFGARADGPFRQHPFSTRAEILKPPRTPRILMSIEAYKRMLLYVEFAPKEVGWHGTVKMLESGDFLIDMVYLFEQQVTAVETELSIEGQAKLHQEFKVKYGFMKSVEMGDSLKFWGHSHVRMEVYPSGTDESTMVRMGNDRIEWYIRGIFNKLGKAKFDLYRFDRNYRILDVPWQVIDPATGRVIMTESPKGMWGGAFTRWSPSSDQNAANPAVIAANTANAQKSDNAPTTEVASPAGVKIDGTKSGDTAATGTASAVEAKAEDTTPKRVPHMFDSLPEELRPSEELRAEIRKEYDEKVDERMFRSSLWSSQIDTSLSTAKPDLVDDRWFGDGSPGTTKFGDEPKSEFNVKDEDKEPKPGQDETNKSPADLAAERFSSLGARISHWLSDFLGIGGSSSGEPKKPSTPRDLLKPEVKPEVKPNRPSDSGTTPPGSKVTPKSDQSDSKKDK